MRFFGLAGNNVVVGQSPVPKPAYGRFYALYKGKHILADCSNVASEVCLDDQRMLNVMAQAATKAGATVISQVRYHFGHNSPPGFTAVVLLDESHVSAHCYADTGQIALDVFTCGTTDPKDVLRYIREELDLGTVTIKEEPRFAKATPSTTHTQISPFISV